MTDPYQYQLEPEICSKCEHYVFVHPCRGWCRKPWFKIGGLVWLRRCHCKVAV